MVKSPRRRSLPPPVALLAVTAALAACAPEATPRAKPPVAVLTQEAQFAEQRPEVRLTGTVEAQTLSELGFRLSGRVVDRLVDVGDRVRAGDVLARLDPETQRADVAAAEAGVLAAEASLRQAEVTFERQAALLRTGNTTRAIYEDADEVRRSAAAALDTARAELGIASDDLANTELTADADGVVTARSVEVGQVVEAARTVFTLAQDGGRDAVFDVYEALLTHRSDAVTVDIALVSDPAVRTVGTVRQVSPVIDPDTGSVRVKVALPADLPQAMTLGAPVVGTASFSAGSAVAVPWTALSSRDGRPVVFVIDPAGNAVAPRTVAVTGYRTGVVLVGDGLASGDAVVVAGTQFLRDGDVVEPRVVRP